MIKFNLYYIKYIYQYIKCKIYNKILFILNDKMYYKLEYKIYYIFVNMQ